MLDDKRSGASGDHPIKTISGWGAGLAGTEFGSAGFYPRSAGSNPASVNFSALERCVLAMAMRRALGAAAQAAARWRAKHSRFAQFGERSNEPIMHSDVEAIAEITATYVHVWFRGHVAFACWMPQGVRHLSSLEIHHLKRVWFLSRTCSCSMCIEQDL